MMDDFVKHIFRKHNQGADHLANVVTEEQREERNTIERVKNTEEWNAVVIGMVAKKENGRSDCGVAIKAVDRES